jgi:hypothetical protein
MVSAYFKKYKEGIAGLDMTPGASVRSIQSRSESGLHNCEDGSKIGLPIKEVGMRDMIRTLHPEKKQGVNISKEKYEIIRNAILCVLQTQKEITFMNLSRAVEKEVNGNFEGSVTWYVTTVKLDLEARGQIKRVPKSRPQLVKLA